VREDLCTIWPLAGALADVKRVSNEGSGTWQKWAKLTGLVRRFPANVKKVPNGRLQGLDPGEIEFGDFPFRLKKSRK
jgi:hypothetical protein